MAIKVLRKKRKTSIFISTVPATLPTRTASQSGSFILGPLIQAKILGGFFMMHHMIYDKKPTTIDEQLRLLQSRGLTIDNVNTAKKYLSEISYYRLSGYWWTMQEDKVSHQFKLNSTFSDVIALYNFDSDLRLLLFNVFSKIEISLRTKMIYHLSNEFDPWWFQDLRLFTDTKELVKSLAKLAEEIERSKDTFIKEHRKKYKADNRFPPAWKSLELTSFGTLSKLYGNLKNTIKSKDAIAQEYGAVNHTYLPSWLQAFSHLRNFCAHHSRLWNRNLPSTVKLLPKPPFPWLNQVPGTNEFSKIYIHVSLMRYLLNRIDPKNTFSKDFQHLLKAYPNIDPNILGLKQQWQNEPLWML